MQHQGDEGARSLLLVQAHSN